MTLSEIKDQYAKELGYDNFRDLQFDFAWWDELRDVEDFMDEIALRYFEANKREYATACCKATQEKCAESAVIGEYKTPSGDMVLLVSEIPILSPNNIVLL